MSHETVANGTQFLAMKTFSLVWHSSLQETLLEMFVCFRKGSALLCVLWGCFHCQGQSSWVCCRIKQLDTVSRADILTAIKLLLLKDLVVVVCDFFVCLRVFFSLIRPETYLYSNKVRLEANAHVCSSLYISARALFSCKRNCYA